MTTTTAAPDRRPARISPLASHVLRRPEAGAAVGAAVVFVFFAAFGGPGGFLTAQGTASWLGVAAELGIIAIPVGLLMIAGEFDLSVGSVLATSSMVVAVSVSEFGLPPIFGVVLALGFGLGVGFLNGYLVVKTGLPSFIVTLVTLFALAGGSLGLSRALAGTTSVSMTSDGIIHELFAARWEQFNVSIIWWLVAAAIAYWVLQVARFGNWTYAIGGDLDTARLNGVPIRTVKTRLYMYSSFSAALVGVIQAFEFGNADVTRGQSFVFQAIVAAVVGGCLLSGGYGSVIGIVLGSATYAIISIGIYYTGWYPDLVQLFVGALLLLAVIGNNFVRRLALTRP
jgi:simple sugar transport system permease protein